MKREMGTFLKNKKAAKKKQPNSGGSNHVDDKGKKGGTGGATSGKNYNSLQTVKGKKKPPVGGKGKRENPRFSHKRGKAGCGQDGEKGKIGLWLGGKNPMSSAPR